jgi:hypothetical protein
MSDVIEVQRCPICGQGLDVNSRDTIDYGGQLIHSECVAEADARGGNPPKGYNPNNSYT